MQKIPSTQIKETGRMILVYGETGSGKTTSIIQSAPTPIAYIQTEHRSVKPSIDAAGREGLQMDVFLYDEFFDLIEFLANLNNFTDYRTIAFDGLSHFMNIQLGAEIGEEKKEDKKEIKLVEERITLPDRGVINTCLFRTVNLLGKVSQRGKVVICTALLYENPKWDRSLSAAPGLGGREVPANIPAYFDLIGLVQKRKDADGNPVWPPWVKFESGDDSFMCKFTGKKKRNRPAEGPLNFSKILGM